MVWERYVVTKDCEDLEAVARLLDIVYSDEYAVLTAFGQEGVNFTYEDGVMTPIPGLTADMAHEQRISEGAMLWNGVLPRVQEVVREFFGKEIGSTAVWFEPVNDPMKLLLYSFLFGIIHLFAGLAVRFYMLWKDGKKLDAFCDVVPVYLLVAGIAPLGAGIIIDVPQTLTTIGKYVALVGAVLTVLLVTRVQNMDDHQSLAVAPFYLLGLYMLALLAANLPGKWLRRALAALVSVGCAINFAGCSQLMPIKLPGAWYSGLFFTIDNERTDMAQIAEVNDFLRENCEGDNSAYMICHGLTYSADVFRAAALPDESIRSILAYGAVNPGNDAFPKELFTAQIVLTCTPFDPSNHTEKINSAFLENVETLHCFEVAAEFDMGNGYTITAYRRVKAPAVAELDAYRRWLAEEDEQFPYKKEL